MFYLRKTVPKFWIWFVDWLVGLQTKFWKPLILLGYQNHKIYLTRCLTPILKPFVCHRVLRDQTINRIDRNEFQLHPLENFRQKLGGSGWVGSRLHYWFKESTLRIIFCQHNQCCTFPLICFSFTLNTKVGKYDTGFLSGYTVFFFCLR